MYVGIGFRFSEIETAVIIAKLLQRYELVLPKDNPKMQTENVLNGRIDMWQQVTLKPNYLRVECIHRKF
jgi:cytochrome P450